VKKKFFQNSILLIVLTMAAISAALALGNSGETENFSKAATIDNPIMVDDSIPAAYSMAAMYAPNEKSGMEYWQGSVCTGMTNDGCEYFKSNQALEAWESQLGHAADFVSSVTQVAAINDSAEVWQAHITIFVTVREKIEQDVFIVVERGEDGRWYLDRVL